MSLKYNFFGEKAIIIDLKNIINNKISIAWKAELCLSLKKEFNEIVEDVVFSSFEITIFFKFVTVKSQKKNIINWIKSFNLKKQNISRNIWEIPACFDKTFSNDILVQKKYNLIAYETYISEFLKCKFEAHHYGFLPGFLYLSGLPLKNHLPRKPSPEKSIYPGTIAVGESNVGIYPQVSPGGWNRIGRTHCSLFNRKINPPCYVLPGDKIKFISISLSEYQNNINKPVVPKSSSFEISL